MSYERYKDKEKRKTYQRELMRNRRALEKAKREPFESELKRLGLKDKLPKMFWSYSDYKEAMEQIGWERKSYDEWIKEKARWIENKRAEQTDIEVASVRLDRKRFLHYCKRFLRFDLYEQGHSRKICEIFRLSWLGVLQENPEVIEINNFHLDVCEGDCQLWLYNLKHGTLQAMNSNEVFKGLNYMERKETLSKECERFRSMVLGEIPRDAFFMDGHITRPNQCIECLNFRAKHKRSLKGANLWSTEREKTRAEKQIEKEIFDEECMAYQREQFPYL